MKSFRVLCSELPWARETVPPFSMFIKADKNDDLIGKFDDFMFRTNELISRETSNLKSLNNITTVIDIIEHIIININDVHSALQEIWPVFDTKLMPLIEKYTELLVYQARSTDSQQELMDKLVKLLTNLTSHPTLPFTPGQRAEAILIQLITKLLPYEPGFVEASNPIPLPSEPDNQANLANSVNCKDQYDCSNSDRSQKCSSNVERSVIPETPPPQNPVCVGVATIKEILPVPMNGFFPVTPPPTGSTDTSFLSKSKEEISSIFPTPTSLCKLQKDLRRRFRTPNAVTPTEKRISRKIIRSLRSKNRLKPPAAWNVAGVNTLPLKKHTAVVEQSIFSAESESTQDSPYHNLALYLSPDGEQETYSFLTTPLKSGIEQQKPDYCDNVGNTNFPLPTRRVLLLDERSEASRSSESEKNGGSYTELKKSIEGNLMGCEASLSDIELMDEIESSLNLEAEEDAALQSSCIKLVDNSALPLKTKALPEIEPSVLPIVDSTDILPPGLTAPSKTKTAKSKQVKKPKTVSNKEQLERRRSSRLAANPAIPPLPLKYTYQQLPVGGKVTTKLANSSNQSSTQKEKQDQCVPSVQGFISSEASENVVPSPFQNQDQGENLLNSSLSKPDSPTPPPIVKVAWQEIRSFLPVCWADLIENHVKIHHPDEFLRYQDIPEARCPTVYCNCTPSRVNYESNCNVEYSAVSPR